MPLDGLSFACPDWADRLRRGQTPITDLPLDPVIGDAAVDLFNLLRVPDIPGQPTMAEVGGDWIRDIVRAAFGSIDRETGKRFVGEIFNLIPKKNSKTTNAAALGLIALLMNRRPNIDGVIIGPTQEVADKCFAQAAGMIEADPYLRRRFKVIEHKKTILDLHQDEETGVRMNAKLKIKSFDPKVVTGSIPAFAIIDELHLMAEMNHAERVIGQTRRAALRFEVAGHDLVDAVVAINRHGEAVALALQASGADDRGEAQNVIEGREREPRPAPQTQAEVLGVPVRGPDQEEEDLRPEERLPVLDGRVGFPQKFHDLRDAGAAQPLVFHRRRVTQRLADILLRQAFQGVALPNPVDRSTESTICPSNVSFSTCATGRPISRAKVMQNSSFSTLSLRSICSGPGMMPMGVLKIWLVGVMPRSLAHCPSIRR